MKVDYEIVHENNNGYDVFFDGKSVGNIENAKLVDSGNKKLKKVLKKVKMLARQGHRLTLTIREK